MLIALIIVSIIAALELFIIIKCGIYINNMMEEMVMQPDLYPCELLMVINFNQKEDSVITDFSRYEEHKQIGLIIQKKAPPRTKEEKMIDGKMVIRPQSAVYKAGGQWLWKLG